MRDNYHGQKWSTILGKSDKKRPFGRQAPLWVVGLGSISYLEFDEEKGGTSLCSIIDIWAPKGHHKIGVREDDYRVKGRVLCRVQGKSKTYGLFAGHKEDKGRGDSGPMVWA